MNAITAMFIIIKYLSSTSFVPMKNVIHAITTRKLLINIGKYLGIILFLKSIIIPNNTVQHIRILYSLLTAIHSNINIDKGNRFIAPCSFTKVRIAFNLLTTGQKKLLFFYPHIFAYMSKR